MKQLIELLLAASQSPDGLSLPRKDCEKLYKQLTTKRSLTRKIETLVDLFLTTQSIEDLDEYYESTFKQSLRVTERFLDFVAARRKEKEAAPTLTLQSPPNSRFRLLSH